MLQLTTLMAVLVANGYEETITKALLIDTDNNKPEHEVGDTLIVQVEKGLAQHHIGKDYKFKSDNYRYNLPCPIVKINPYKLKDIYGVNVAVAGKPIIVWVAGNYASEPSDTVLTDEAQARITKAELWMKELNGTDDRIVSPQPEEPMI